MVINSILLSTVWFSCGVRKPGKTHKTQMEGWKTFKVPEICGVMSDILIYKVQVCKDPKFISTEEGRLCLWDHAKQSSQLPGENQTLLHVFFLKLIVMCYYLLWCIANVRFLKVPIRSFLSIFKASPVLFFTIMMPFLAWI